MEKIDAADRAGRLQTERWTPVRWLIAGPLLALIGVLLLGAIGQSIEAGEYLGYLASKATVFDAWSALTLLSGLLSLAAIAGAGVALFRKRFVLALAFAALAAPAHVVIEASRCDTEASCRLLGWAALPASARQWSTRIRPVADQSEALDIAAAAISKPGSKDSPFKARQFSNYWIVSTIDRDGWPGAHAVQIDTRTARASLVACPQGQIQCGMERPVLSDGRRSFQNDKLGLAAIFPGARPVCTSRGEDDKPRGFVANARAPAMPCEIVDQSRQLGVEVARDRRNGCMAADAPALPWRPLSPQTARLFRRGPARLDGRPTLACELRIHGDIQISVYAFAASPRTSASSPGALYEAYIVTTPAHLAEDVRTFEVFIGNVHIGFPADQRTG